MFMHLSCSGLTDHEIVSQATLLLFAGYETTATTLSFLAYNLARNPEVMKRLQEEIDSTFSNKVPSWSFWFRSDSASFVSLLKYYYDYFDGNLSHIK